MRYLRNDTTTLALVLAILGFATAAQAGPQLYKAKLIIHAFANDATGALQALPLGAYCNPENSGMACNTNIIHKGAPINGEGIPITTGLGPVSFQFLSSAFARTTSGSLPPYPGVSYTLTTAMLQNGSGSFGPSKGPGSFSFVPTLGAGLTHIAVVAGKNRFGGVMQLIGSFGTRTASSTSGGGKWKGVFPTWGVTVIGASYAKTAVISGVISYTPLSLTYPSVAVVTGFPWTTGQVSVVAAGDGFSTALVRTGYDNRTDQGVGTIQMVAPRLTHWAGGTHWGDVAVLKVEFVPEPSSWLMLVSGAGLLSVSYRRRR